MLLHIPSSREFAGLFRATHRGPMFLVFYRNPEANDAPVGEIDCKHMLETKRNMYAETCASMPNKEPGAI
jgi:hypothetical protein